MEVKVEDVTREVIKPASTSSHDRLQLSTYDLRCPAIYVPIIFFYKTEDLATVSPPETISKNLKASLSLTLSRFHPLAGRLEGVSINCNDEGAVFTEACTDLLLHDFLRNFDIDSLKSFYPTMAPGDCAAEWPLLSVKVTFFGSGSGVAISVYGSHRICDASSLLIFVKDWAATITKKKSKDTITFAETTMYPPPPYTSFQFPSIVNMRSKIVTNRFVFESSKIAELKRKAASESVFAPTRVEAISALVWRCAKNASQSQVPRSKLMFTAMDLRGKIPFDFLSPHAVGNLLTRIFIKKEAESDLNLRETVAAFRKAREGVIEMIKENLEANTLGEYLSRELGNFGLELKPEVELYTMTSWCKKRFYEIDFGWGDAVWMGSVFLDANAMYVLLIDSKDGDDVEAMIGLPEQDMPRLLHDKEFLAYASLNPPVLI